ncbi:probable LRR receptor-like serine/threonine-protein kinase At4g29180 isoform X2 [Cajanus cajan]|uniref:probable LRR receptor-like serine/threonine-protein kinase At4g29180 isoform X2 n=1 Tax=Cajanus cajan TaxID=3821 RepID=UPI00098D974A|nr:probable LRR receptor-like serine/threonine-protein kinase At4g29180 isoform X2 [Cajanus cajan]
MTSSIGCILLLTHCVALVALVYAQQQTGFISIDCGGPQNFEYTDDTTKIKYGTDGAYIQTGVNKNISSNYAYPNNPMLPQPLSDLRSFPEGERNCYKLIAGRKGSLHLIRASFLYGNYDGENKPPEFDLYVDVNFWSTIKFRNASDEVTMETISVAQSGVTNVCLVNKGEGTPFISGLELRPLNASIYNTEFGEFGSLTLFKRWDFGSLNGSGRYEDDIYDRIWSPYNSSSLDSVSTSTVINVNGDGYKAPFEVIKTAATTPKSDNDPLEFSWTPDDPSWKFYVYLYFAEVEQLNKTQLRKFNISWNGSPLFESIVPHYLFATTLSNSKSLVANEHRISIHKTKDSTLPPILNAVEIYVVRQLDALPTFEQDVDAMMAIRENYRIQRNWMGDPCEPKNYSWEGLECNYTTSLPPRIISLNMSSSSLSGTITSAISNLSSLESLDLHNNSLTGAMPQFLEELKYLKYLDLRSNLFSGSVSATLLERSRTGSLTLRVDDQNHGDTKGNNKTKKIVIPIVASVLSILVLLIVFILVQKLRRNERSEISMLNKGGKTVTSKNWQYTYSEVLNITNNFEMAIGKGGFGTVYCGQVKDGKQVAVKMLSPSSTQGPKEFQTEAELLMTVHHKNLVSFIGYCDDDNKMALIYEYMANGSLKDFLSLSDGNSHSLSWERRIQIAIDAAEGLDYLHHGCKPPIIHRDVKSANILLSQDLEAKIADFGLSREFRKENQNQDSSMIYNDVSNEKSAVMGTTGYLDPEYYKLGTLNEKSDIYSFGIVLLELITGRPAILKSLGNPLMHILEWIRSELEGGDLSRILDPRLQGKFDTSSGWKALGIAMACSASTSNQRPTMNVVLAELKQCLKLESPNETEIFVAPKQVYNEFYSSSEAFSCDSESITYPFPR